MNEITFTCNSGELTAKSLPDLINMVLREFICDDSISYKFLEIQIYKKEIIVYVPAFMIDESEIDDDFEIIVNKDCIMFSIENTNEATIKFLNHISKLWDQDDEITITESKETI